MKQITVKPIGIGIVATIALAIPFIAAQAYGDPIGVQGKNAFNTPTVGKITPWDAMKIATKASGGKALQATYEFDDGQWIYGVMVVKNHKLLEVEIDPTTGKVNETEATTPDAEIKELKADLAKAVATAGK
ncbi:MAG: PepSY domain-containing protein [Fimbriimonas sp.]|nr:PepSY domain-containing protein [Fimbriimonas sp.]